MKKALLTLTIAVVAVSAAVMAVVGLTAPLTSATPSLCHSSTLTITAPKTATRGTAITVTGGEPQTPAAHRQSDAAVQEGDRDGVEERRLDQPRRLRRLLAQVEGSAAKGKYKVRVRVTHSSASNTSAAKTVTVK